MDHFNLKEECRLSRIVVLFAIVGLLVCAVRTSRAESQKRLKAEAPNAPTVPAPSDVAAAPPDARKLASGIDVKVLLAGHGSEHPAENDCVRVRFTSWKRDGSLFSTSGLHGETAVQCVNSMMPGVAAGITTMFAGEKLRIWVPAKMAFAPRHHRGADNMEMNGMDMSRQDGAVRDRMSLDLKPALRMDLTFDVELIEIIKTPATPAHLNAAPKDAIKTTSGLAYKILEHGTGTEHPIMSSQVTVHFSGWTSDGKLFESTAIAGHPAVVYLSNAVPGWREGVMHMRVGEKSRFWIPAVLAYGEKPVNRMSPAGNLVYDIQLLAIQ